MMIIGVNSTVTHDIPAGMVAAGCPARVLCTTEAYLEKECARMAHAPCYGQEYTLRRDVSMEKLGTDEKRLSGRIGYIDRDGRTREDQRDRPGL